MAQESTTETKEQLLYIGYLESKDVLTTDGRLGGFLRALLIDPKNWTVASMVVEVDRDILEEVGIKKPLLDRALVDIPAKFVKGASDVIQLNEDLEKMRGSVNLYWVR